MHSLQRLRERALHTVKQPSHTTQNLSEDIVVQSFGECRSTKNACSSPVDMWHLLGLYTVRWCLSRSSLKHSRKRSQKSLNNGLSMALRVSLVAASTDTYSCVTGFSALQPPTVMLLQCQYRLHCCSIERLTQQVKEGCLQTDMAAKMAFVSPDAVWELCIGHEESGDAAAVQLLYERVDLWVHDWLAHKRQRAMPRLSQDTRVVSIGLMLYAPVKTAVSRSCRQPAMKTLDTCVLSNVCVAYHAE